jgi:hypothetical protein
LAGGVVYGEYAIARLEAGSGSGAIGEHATDIPGLSWPAQGVIIVAQAKVGHLHQRKDGPTNEDQNAGSKHYPGHVRHDHSALRASGPARNPSCCSSDGLWVGPFSLATTEEGQEAYTW